MLHTFLTANREELISRRKVKVGMRSAPRATEEELQYGIPIFLTQLTEVLREESLGSKGSASTRKISRTAENHGNELLLRGVSVDQIVRDYGDLCQAVTELIVHPTQNRPSLP